MNQQAETPSKSAMDSEATDPSGAAATTEAVPTDSSIDGPPDASGAASSGRLGAIGLLVALLAAAGVGYVWTEQRAQGDLNRQVAKFEADLDARGDALKRLLGDVESMMRETRRFDEQLTALKSQADEQFEELPMRIRRLERTVDSMPGVASDVRAAWLRAEAEYFLRIANAQLNLAGNVDVSITALELADEKLKALSDPRLTPVRAQLSDERAALSTVPRPDAEGIVLRLGSLARSIDALPLARRAPEQFGNRRSADETESGLERAWRVIVDALMNIITVKHEDEITPLMSQADESMLIRSLDIELQIARLAVIRNEAGLYEQSLQAVTERLERYFDTNAPDVVAALETVTVLRQVKLPESLPDISGSLTLLLRLGNESVSP